MSKPTITRVGERITKIRFEVNPYIKPHIQHLAIVDSMPADQALREWRSKGHDIAIVDGWAEVTPR